MPSWFPGADEFSPAKCAHEIRYGLRPQATPEERETIVALWRYHVEYLRVTSHCDGARPSPMADGTVVYWSPQATTMAVFFVTAYSMAAAWWDDDSDEQAAGRSAWCAADWDAIWEQK